MIGEMIDENDRLEWKKASHLNDWSKMIDEKASDCFFQAKMIVHLSGKVL